MKRRVEEAVKADNSGGYPSSPISPPRHTPRTLATVSNVVQSSYTSTIKSTSDLRNVQSFSVQTGFSNAMPAITPPAIKSANSGGLQGGAQQTHSSLHSLQPHSTLRHKVHGGSMTPPTVSAGVQNSQQPPQMQRLKVEDALSYLDLVKFKFGDQPQVYNDFLDIMKEFKSQSIDTPGVIDRVSNLFNGHSELIVGFNTFLPPGYKIEVKSNDQGYSYEVQVSMPSPSASTTTLVPSVPPVHHSQVIPGGLPSVVVSSAKPLLMPNAMVTQHAGAVNTAPTHVTPCTAPTVPPPAPVQVPAPPHYTNHTATPSQVTAGMQQVQPHPTVSQTLSHVETAPQQPTPQNQPVEFNHAINYVNKIKNRFQGQPDKYKRFLEILHTYQKEQRNLKEGTIVGGGQGSGSKQLTEAEVYSQVAKLFENQEDLLAEFGQFLPDATSHQTTTTNRKCEEIPISRKPSVGIKMSSSYNSNNASSTSANSSPGPVGGGSGGGQPKLGITHTPVTTAGVRTDPGQSSGLKRSPSFSSQPVHHQSSTSGHHHHPPTKKHKLSSFKDVSLAEVGKYGTLNDFAFFDKVRKALRSQDVYENFLRCLVLFNQEIVSKGELLQLATPFLGRFPELFRWFKEYLGLADGPPIHVPGSSSPSSQGQPVMCDNIINNVSRQERPTGDQAMDIDYATCKRLGASYCAVPKNHPVPRCSGRTALCKEVLNDTWVSFPTWSEESTFVTSRKTQYEEYIYRCEDERFELDVVIETNAATIRVLEGVHKKLCRLSSEEVAKFRLDDCLGGASPTIHQRALRRIYGDKGADIIDGLKRNPVVAVPVVLRRLKAKEEEWREAQKGFNKIWREQNEKFYLKSLDHQGINFKQNDVKALRSKSLFNEIETCFDERHEQAMIGDTIPQGPHMILPYKDKSVLDDTANLLIHHVKRQTSIHKEDKQRIKQLLRQFLPDLFHHPRQELSEDEREDADEKMNAEPSSPGSKDNVAGETRNAGTEESLSSKEDDRPPLHSLSRYPDDAYTLFFGNGNWYLFLRLHQILCERLTRMYEQATLLAKDEAKMKPNRKDSTSVALRLKPKTEIEVEEYYPAFLEMVKNVLDGNMEANAYEDTLREMFGIHAYIAFTLDKVVIYAVRQLQHLVADETCTECADLYLRESRRGGAGGLCATAHNRAAAEMAYQRKAEAALADENCFKMSIYKKDCKLTIELLDTEVEDAEAVRETEKWSNYVDRYAESHSKDKSEHSMDVDEDQERRLWGKAVFLPRNVRLWREKVGNDKVDSPKIDACDETQCRFNLNSYRMVFVVNKENYLYKRHALRKARESHLNLSKRLESKFRAWHEAWAAENLTHSQRESAMEWLMGRAPDTIPNETIVLRDNPLDKPPYTPYNRYRVRRLDSKEEK